MARCARSLHPQRSADFDLTLEGGVQSLQTAQLTGLSPAGASSQTHNRNSAARTTIPSGTNYWGRSIVALSVILTETLSHEFLSKIACFTVEHGS
jgi:hypothetical protein